MKHSASPCDFTDESTFQRRLEQLGENRSRDLKVAVTVNIKSP